MLDLCDFVEEIGRCSFIYGTIWWFAWQGPKTLNNKYWWDPCVRQWISECVYSTCCAYCIEYWMTQFKLWVWWKRKSIEYPLVHPVLYFLACSKSQHQVFLFCHRRSFPYRPHGLCGCSPCESSSAPHRAVHEAGLRRRHCDQDLSGASQSFSLSSFRFILRRFSAVSTTALKAVSNTTTRTTWTCSPLPTTSLLPAAWFLSPTTSVRFHVSPFMRRTNARVWIRLLQIRQFPDHHHPGNARARSLRTGFPFFHFFTPRFPRFSVLRCSCPGRSTWRWATIWWTVWSRATACA